MSTRPLLDLPVRPVLRSDRGEVLRLDVERWFAEPSDAERQVLAHALGAVLDVGCGPARHTLALLAAGVSAVGIDVSPRAVRIASRRGAPVLRGSIFDRVPDEGSWGSALLLDGNVGIGGDPVRLLARIRGLLRTGGRALVEVDAPGTPTGRRLVRLEGTRRGGGWFPWARVGADRLADLARRAGFAAVSQWSAEGRWFGRLDV